MMTVQRQFWEQLPVNDESSDLETEREKAEESDDEL